MGFAARNVNRGDPWVARIISTIFVGDTQCRPYIFLYFRGDRREMILMQLP